MMTEHHGGAVSALQLWFTAPRQLELREQKLYPNRDQLLIRSLCSAVSAGTELLAYRGQLPADMALDSALKSLSGDTSYPLQYGYACVGQVEAVGCRDHEPWLGKLVFSFQPHASHFLAVPEQLIELPSGIYEEAAVLLPNMETAINRVHDGAPVLGEQVVVLGQGVVGLLLSAVLTRYPLASLAVVDGLKRRQQQAAQWGVSSVHGCEDDDIAALKEQLRQHADGADLVFEVSGSPQALNSAIDLSGFSSRIVVGSWYGQKSAPLMLGGEAHRNRLNLVTSQVSSIAPALSGRWDKARRHASAWQMIREIGPQQLISHRLPLEQAASLYDMLDQGAEDVLQAVFIYD